jgi:hypothetical protein
MIVGSSQESPPDHPNANLIAPIEVFSGHLIFFLRHFHEFPCYKAYIGFDNIPLLTEFFHQ